MCSWHTFRLKCSFWHSVMRCCFRCLGISVQHSSDGSFPFRQSVMFTFQIHHFERDMRIQWYIHAFLGYRHKSYRWLQSSPKIGSDTALKESTRWINFLNRVIFMLTQRISFLRWWYVFWKNWQHDLAWKWIQMLYLQVLLLKWQRDPEVAWKWIQNIENSVFQKISSIS